MRRSLFAIALLFCVTSCQLSELQTERQTLGLASATPDTPAMRNITGVAEAVGPQALLIEGIVFNLSGVDAPVSGTTAANLAQQMLARLVDGKVVTCAAKDSIAASRERAICFEGRLDVASALVASGTVLACADVSGAAYRFLETNAARASLRRSGNC